MWGNKLLDISTTVSMTHFIQPSQSDISQWLPYLSMQTHTLFFFLFVEVDIYCLLWFVFKGYHKCVKSSALRFLNLMNGIIKYGFFFSVIIKYITLPPPDLFRVWWNLMCQTLDICFHIWEFIFVFQNSSEVRQRNWTKQLGKIPENQHQRPRVRPWFLILS